MVVRLGASIPAMANESVTETMGVSGETVIRRDAVLASQGSERSA